MTITIPTASIGTKAANAITDSAGNDIIVGLAGDDVITFNGGHDIVDGGSGIDTGIFRGAFSDYRIGHTLFNLVTTVQGNGEWANLVSVEKLAFDNGVYDNTTNTFAANTVSLTGGGSVGEGGDLTFTFTRTGDLTRSYDANFTADGAANAADFGLAAIPNHVTFAAGSSTATLTLHALNDGVYEGSQALNLHLTADASHFVFGASHDATGTVLDAQTMPSFSVSDASGSEGGIARFHITLSGPSEQPVDVTYATQGNTASGMGVDYSGFNPTVLTFAPGETDKIVDVALRTDNLVEGPEKFFLNLTAPHGATIADGQGVGTIIDTTVPTLPVVTVANSGGPVSEAGGVMDFTFHRTGNVSQALTVNYTHDGNGSPAQATDADFTTPIGNSITFAAGSSDAHLILNTFDDTQVEGFETLAIRVQPSAGYTVPAPNSGGVSVNGILDNDTAPPPQVTHVSFYADAPAAVEGSDLTFHFHRDVADAALDVKYWMGTFQAGGATPGTDFTADGTTFTFVPKVVGSSDFEAGQDHWADPSMSVHFNAGSADTTLVLHTVNDGIAEPFGEAFTVQFDFANNPSNVVFDSAAGQAAYHAAYPGADPTQVNIGHIMDGTLT